MIISDKTIKEWLKRKKIGAKMYYFLVCPCCQDILSNSKDYIVGFHTKQEAIKALEQFFVDKAKGFLNDTFYNH